MSKTKRLAPLWKFAEVSPPTPEFANLTRNDEVTFIPLEDVWPTYTANDFQTVNWESRLTGYTPFRRGDLLLPKVTPTVTHGRTMIANITTNLGAASTEVYTVRARLSTDPRWLAYLLVDTEFLGLAGASVQGTGGLKRISTQFVESYPLPDATPDEQRAIANYLDRETAEIDGMRADLDDMERLLTERRQSIISETLTRNISQSEAGGRILDGTNHSAPLWKFAEVSPPTPEFANLTETSKVTFISLEDVWPTCTADDFHIVTWEKRLAGYTAFRSGDLLLPKVTPTVTHGRAMIAYIATDVGVASTEVYTVRARPETDPRWLAYLLVSTEFLGLAGASVQGTGGLKRISTQFVESYLLPNVTLNEQRRIADEIDHETAEIDSMLEDITKLRDLLTERRVAVISAAVTGQIDIPVSSTAKDEPHA